MEKPKKKSQVDIAVIKIDKRLDAMNSKKLQTDFDTMLKQSNRIIFDCESLDFIDSSGLGAIVSCLRKAEGTGGGLCLAGLGPKAKMVFEITRAESLIDMYNDVQTAKASFAK